MTTHIHLPFPKQELVTSCSSINNLLLGDFQSGEIAPHSAALSFFFLFREGSSPQAAFKKKIHRRGCRGGRNKSKHKCKSTETIKIFNFSSHSLSPEEISLLGKGLTFSPTILPNSFLLFKDLNKFIRNLTLKRFFNIQSAKNLSVNNIQNTTPVKAVSPNITIDDSPESPISIHEFESDGDFDLGLDFELLNSTYPDFTPGQVFQF